MRCVLLAGLHSDEVRLTVAVATESGAFVHGVLCRATGQHEYADDMLQRCLYALEMAWHPWCAAAPSCACMHAGQHF